MLLAPLGVGTVPAVRPPLPLCLKVPYRVLATLPAIALLIHELVPAEHGGLTPLPAMQVCQTLNLSTIK